MCSKLSWWWVVAASNGYDHQHNALPFCGRAMVRQAWIFVHLLGDGVPHCQHWLLWVIQSRHILRDIFWFIQTDSTVVWSHANQVWCSNRRWEKLSLSPLTHHDQYLLFLMVAMACTPCSLSLSSDLRTQKLESDVTIIPPWLNIVLQSRMRRLVVGDFLPWNSRFVFLGGLSFPSTSSIWYIIWIFAQQME